MVLKTFSLEMLPVILLYGSAGLVFAEGEPKGRVASNGVSCPSPPRSKHALCSRPRHEGVGPARPCASSI
eukprot:4892299-Alexandrium_andersonii.AAC.1